MKSAKFQVVIRDIEENMLGPVLGALPNGIHPEIMRTDSRAINLAPKVPPPLPKPAKPHNLPKWLVGAIDGLPAKFASPELVPALNAANHASGSITHFLRRAINAGYIRKVPGTAGTLTRYEKIKA